MARSSIALHSSGSVIAVTDGPELLVWSQSNGDPLYKQFSDEILVGVALAGQKLVTLGDSGELAWRNLTDGTKEQLSALQKQALCLAMFDEQRLVVSLIDGLWIYASGQPLWLPIDGVTSVAYGSGGAAIIVGCQNGSVHLIDSATAESQMSVQMEGAVVAVSASLKGYEVATSTELIFLSPVLELLAKSNQSQPINALAACQISGLVAVASGGDNVDIFSDSDHAKLGSIEYPTRRVDSLTFGGQGVLGVGIEDGDANWFDLLSGDHAQTAPHQGRAFANWRVNRAYKAATIRGHLARSMAGGAAIAVAQTVADDPEAKKGMSIWMIVGIVVLLVFICTGCCGLAGTGYYLTTGTS